MKHSTTRLPRPFIFSALLAALFLANLPYLALRLERVAFAQTNTNAVTVTWVTPTNGQTVSGTIPLVVNAGSSVAPITRVEFYRDGVLIGVVSNPPTPPVLTSIESP